jgi:hypothetical protein
VIAAGEQHRGDQGGRRLGAVQASPGQPPVLHLRGGREHGAEHHDPRQQEAPDRERDQPGAPE